MSIHCATVSMLDALYSEIQSTEVNHTSHDAVRLNSQENIMDLLKEIHTVTRVKVRQESSSEFINGFEMQQT